MAIGITLLNEGKNGVFMDESNCINIIKDNWFDLIEFNFSIWEDLIDYYEFQEYDNFIFICNGNRIKKIVEYLNENTDCEFSLYNLDLNFICGVNYENMNENITVNTQPKELDDSVYIQNGVKSFYSGMYNYDVQENMLKHIYLDKAELVYSFNIDFFLNLPINSAVIVNQEVIDFGGNEVIPAIYFNEYYLAENTHKFEDVSKKELEQRICQFKETGMVNNNGYISIKDFGLKLRMTRNNRLFYFEDGIFMDWTKEKKLTDNVHSDFETIKNHFSLSGENETYEGERTNIAYFDLYNLIPYFNKRKANFITSFNDWYLPGMEEGNFSNLIGFYNADDDLCFNVESNRLFATDKNFLICLEFYIKGRLNDSKLVDNLGSNYDSIIKEFEQLIDHFELDRT